MRTFRFPASFSLLLLLVLPTQAVEIPAVPLSNLSSDEFQNRKSAESEILAWARKDPGRSINALFEHSRSSPDPEVRDRCLSILRDLVIDEYLRDGEGYIGIRMQDEVANVPGDPKPRGAVRVIQIMPGSAAETGGLQVNDLIVGVNDDVWREGVISTAFTGRIRQFKPMTVIHLKVLRAGAVVDLPVKLGRRPPFAENPFVELSEEELAEAEKATQAAHFKRWLEQRRAQK